jgi:hypothetical protein
MSVVILKRDYKDEKIDVTVSMPNLEGGPEFDDKMVRMMMRMLARTMRKKMMRVPEIAAFL